MLMALYMEEMIVYEKNLLQRCKKNLKYQWLVSCLSFLGCKLFDRKMKFLSLKQVCEGNVEEIWF